MRTLLDENLPLELADHLPGHEVSTVRACGWSGIKNGQLLGSAQEKFDLLITADRNMQYQNAIARFQIALMVLRTKSTRAKDVIDKAPAIMEALPRVRPGQALEVA